MKVERYLQISMACVASLGTLLLGLGQQNIALPLVAVFAAVTSVIFTDRLGWFQLTQHAANLAALGALVYAVINFINQDASGQLLAIANLLIYLQIILLYQRKYQRIYWMLLMLSLLQVVVSAALNLGFEFGILLVTYMFLALGTFTLLFIYCETLPFSGESQPLSVLVHQNTQLGSKLQRTSQKFRANRPGQDLGHSMLNRGLILQILRLGVTTLLMTFAVFFLTPRLGGSAWRNNSINERFVGFSDEVFLNDLGNILESPEAVMRVQFTSLDGTQPIQVHAEPYLRGAVLATYIPRVGRWFAERSLVGDIQRLPIPNNKSGLIRQTIALEASDKLFSVAPAYALRDTPGHILWSRETGQLLLQTGRNNDDWGKLRYEIGTTAFHNGWQRRIIPIDEDHDSQGEVLKPNLQRYLLFDEQSFPELKRIASEVLAEDNTITNRQDQMLVLEKFLASSSDFTYTLSMDELPPRKTDPIEHFVAEGRRGHCEYFASALAMMLRSQEIPTRLVVGYHGGEYNKVGHYYQVRQLHAHAWVEAYLRPEDIAEDDLPVGQTAPAGAWMRLDATPASDDGTIAASVTISERMKQYTDYAQMLWNDYVLGLDPERQRTAIYEPLRDFAAKFFQNYLFNPDWWGAFTTELPKKMGLNSWDSFALRWFNWRALPILFGFFALLVASYLVLRRRLKRRYAAVQNWIVNAARSFLRRRRIRVGFYRRFENVLRKHGIRRSRSETPRELAAQASAILKADTNGSQVAGAAEKIVDHYYRVRYGGTALTPRESENVDRLLHALERALLDQQAVRNG